MNSRARSSLLMVAVIVSGMALGVNVATTDKLPTDTNKIESLTIKQARKLADEFPGTEVEIEAVGAGSRSFKYKRESCLPLKA